MTDKKPEDLNVELREISKNIAQLNQDKEKIITDIKTDIKSWCKKYCGYIFGGFSLLTIFALYQIYSTVIDKSTEVITNSITVKFAEPQITQTLKDVAENQAKEIIENHLNPGIQKATSTVNQKIDLFDKDLQEFNNTYSLELKKIAKEVEYIKNRNMLLKLGDKAIAEADAESFEKLYNIYESTSDEDLKLFALSEIFRIKLNFINTTRIKGLEITYTNPETGKSFKNSDIPTEHLIQILKYNPTWEYRAKASELLKERKEKQVPEALLNTLKNDKNLEVRAKAMISFEIITGFKSNDVFLYPPAEDWWNKNKKDISLSELQTIQSALEKNKN